MSIETLLVVLALGGISIFLLGAVYANIVTIMMAKHWNRTHLGEDHIPVWAAWGKGAFSTQVITKYRHESSDGALYRQLRIGYWFIGVGAAFGVGSVLVMKFAGI